MELCHWECHDVVGAVAYHGGFGKKKKTLFKSMTRHDSLQARVLDVDMICRQQECGDGG